MSTSMAWRAEDARRSVGRGREIVLVWLVGGGFWCLSGGAEARNVQ